MSTKIYNGFKMDALNIKEQKIFLDKISNQLEKYYFNVYCEQFTNRMMVFLDNLSILDEKEDFKKLETALETYYINSLSLNKKVNLLLLKQSSKLTHDEMINNFCKYTTIKRLFEDIITEKLYYSEVSLYLADPELHFDSQMILFPQINGKTLFMTFSNKFTDFFVDFINDDNNKNFVNKYHLETYFYQNQTDKPSNISDKNWKMRETEWNLCLQTGIPSKDGISINLYDAEKFKNFIFSKSYEDNIIAQIVPYKERCQKKARELAFDDFFEIYYTKNKNKEKISYKEMNQALDMFDEKLKENDLRATNLLFDSISLCERCLPQMDKNKLSSVTVLDYFPNYKKHIERNKK